jgi:hypothetical protein
MLRSYTGYRFQNHRMIRHLFHSILLGEVKGTAGTNHRVV